MSISKIFIPNIVCVLIFMKDTQNISDGIFILSPGSWLRGGTLGAGGAQGIKKNFKHGHVAYRIDGDDEQNRMQVKFSS